LLKIEGSSDLLFDRVYFRESIMGGAVFPVPVLASEAAAGF